MQVNRLHCFYLLIFKYLFTFSKNDLTEAELLLYDLLLTGSLGNVQRFTFPEPVLADFIDSEYDDFLEYLDDTEEGDDF